jgi:hypothetical protein
MGLIGFRELSVTSYQLALHNTPKANALSVPSHKQSTIFGLLGTQHRHFPSVTQSAGD